LNSTMTARAITWHSLDIFHRQVAEHCANILIGSRIFRDEMTCELPKQLTGIDFEPHDLRPHLKTHLSAKLQVEATDEKITIQVITREMKTTIDGKTETVLVDYLRITAKT
jgi:hypothetical protein